MVKLMEMSAWALPELFSSLHRRQGWSRQLAVKDDLGAEGSGPGAAAGAKHQEEKGLFCVM